MKQSAKYSWNYRDFLHGLIMTVGGAIVPIIMESMTAKSWVFNWVDIWHTGAAAGFVYLAKQFFSAPQVPAPDPKP